MGSSHFCTYSIPLAFATLVEPACRRFWHFFFKGYTSVALDFAGSIFNPYFDSEFA